MICEITDNWLLLGAILAPLLPLLPAWWPAWRESALRLAPLGALPALLLALTGGEGSSLSLPWLLLGTELGLDATGRIFLIFTAWLWLLAAWFAGPWLTADRRSGLFLFFFQIAMTGNFGLILAQDMISFNLFFTLMGLSAYGLVIHRRDPAALRAGRVYLGLVIVGEVLIYIGLLGLVRQWGLLPLAQLAAQDGSLTPSLLACLLLGFGIKAGLVPLHCWLPLAHPAAPVPASAVLSGAMIKAGLLGWLRFLPGSAPDGGELSGGLIILGLLAAFYGVARGLRQSNPKTVLAWSSISQMGLLTVGLGLLLAGGPATAPALLAIQLYAFHHGLAKGALFLAVGLTRNYISEPPPRAIRLLLIPALLLPALSLAGAPLTSGFLAKNLLSAAADQAGSLPLSPTAFTLLLTAGSLATALLMLHLLATLEPHRIFGRPARLAKRGTDLQSAPHYAGVIWQPLLVLLLLVLSGLPWLWSLLPPLDNLLASAPATPWEKKAAALPPLLLAGIIFWIYRRRPATTTYSNHHKTLMEEHEPPDRLALPVRWWQGYNTRIQNARAATHCRRRRLLHAWRERGRQAELLLSSWPVAGAGTIILLLLLLLTIGGH